MIRFGAFAWLTSRIVGGDYLFVEAGGFGPKNPVGWKPRIMVLKRR